MSPHASQCPLASRLDLQFSTRSHHFYSQTTRAIVLVRNVLQSLDTLCISALANEELGRLFEADDGDASERHDEDKRAAGVPHVAPSLVVGFGTWCCVWENGGIEAGEVWDEGPCEESGNELSDAWNMSLARASLLLDV